MAEKNDGGDKTELPTQKRLRDARKKGDVAKSKDLSSVAGLFAWLLLSTFGAGFAGERLIALFDASFTAVAQKVPFTTIWSDLGYTALWLFVLLTAVGMIPAAVIGVFAEFMQVGALLTFEKMKPSLSKLNPVDGIKKLFSMDNLIELAKTVAKAALLLLVTWLVLKASLPEILSGLPTGVLPTMNGVGRSAAAESLHQTGTMTTRMLSWTMGAFLIVAVADAAWQKHSHIKKMKMSRRDIRDEVKEDEGDPYIRQQRKSMHQEYANQNAVGAARGANVLVVNPTHLALAIDYDPDSCPVPMLMAKGEGPLAQAMREAAEAAGVPIIRNVDVARTLFDRGELGDIVPRDMFEAIAEIILWARRERDAMIERRR